MQLVVRAERGIDLVDDEVAAAAAAATVGVLAAAQAAPGGPWADAVARWTRGGRIRKISRRARGAPWLAAVAFEGVTAHVGTAEVHAVVPGPAEQLPHELSRLQVAGLVTVAGPARDPWELMATSTVPTLVAAANPGLAMTAGKLAAQAAHAAHLGWVAADEALRSIWAEGGHRVVLTHPDPETWAGFAPGADVVVTDGGFTEVPAGSTTVVARWAPR